VTFDAALDSKLAGKFLPDSVKPMKSPLPKTDLGKNRSAVETSLRKSAFQIQIRDASLKAVGDLSSPDISHSGSYSAPIPEKQASETPVSGTLR